MGKLNTAVGRSAATSPETSASDGDTLSFDEKGTPSPEGAVDFSENNTPLSASTYEQVTAQLNADLDRDLVRQREGFRGSMLDYLEWTTTVRQLNSIFGYGKWSTTVKEITDMALDDDGIPMGARATVMLTVQFPVSGPMPDYFATVTYENVGFTTTRTNRDGKRTWDAYDMAVKGAVSDALKRCAVNLGNQFGLSLYEKGVQTTSVATPAQARPTTGQSYSSSAESTQDVDAGYSCETCGKAITGYTSKGGKTYTAQQLVAYSKRDCDGHIFCFDHKQSWLNSYR